MENDKENIFLKILNSSIYRLTGIYKNQRIIEKRCVKNEQVLQNNNINKIKEIKIKKEIKKDNKIKEIENRAYVSLLNKIKNIDDIKEHDDNENITPLTIKKEFMKCSSCLYSNKTRVLGDGSEFHPDVLVITDFILSDEERKYLDNILSSVFIKSERNAYITSLIKCENLQNKNDIKTCIDSCSLILNKQIKLLSPKAILGFGKNISDYLKKIKSNLNLSKTTFIYTLMPFEIQNNTEEKRQLWDSLKKLAKLLNLPIKKV